MLITAYKLGSTSHILYIGMWIYRYKSTHTYTKTSDSLRTRKRITGGGKPEYQKRTQADAGRTCEQEKYTTGTPCCPSFTFNSFFLHHAGAVVMNISPMWLWGPAVPPLAVAECSRVR